MLNHVRRFRFALLLAACLPAAARADWEGFLRLDTVTTNATYENYRGWIPVWQVSSVGLQRSPTNFTPALQAYQLTKLTDQYSPALAVVAATAASNTVPLTATLDLVDTNLASVYFRLNLSNVVVQRFTQSGGSADNSMLDQVRLVAGDVSWNSQVFSATDGLPLGSTASTYSYITQLGTETTGKASFMAVGIIGHGGASLSWTATAGKKYQIYAATSLTQPFTAVAQVTVASTGLFNYPITFNLPSMFFVVQALPAGY